MNLGRFKTERAGVVALVVILVAAFPILLTWGDGQWFGQDEWSFIANRKLPTVDGLLAAHNGHWVTIPLVLFRLNFELFGLNSYVPYQILVILAHLTIAALAHTIMRRAGVRAWLATALIVGFVFYGAGWGNILFAFQITLDGSVIAGLFQFVMADHDGKWSRRDTIGVSVAVLGLMTSAVMPAMSVAVGAFVLLRRGWRIAAGHTVPPAVIFIAWYIGFGGSEASDPQASRIVRFMYHMVRATFEGLGRSTPGGLALALIAALGVGGAVAAWRRTGDLVPLAIPAGLLTGVLVFSFLTGFNRSGFGADVAAVAGQGRYIYVCAALLLPIVAMGAQQLWEWRRALVVVPLALIALGLPANIDSLRNRGPFTTGNRDQVTTLAHSELLPQVPGDLRPLPFQDVRAAWLLKAVADGDMPDPPDDMPTRAKLNIDAALALVEEDTSTPACDPVEGRIAQTVHRGDRIVVGGPVQLLLAEGDGRSTPRDYDTGTTVRIQAGPVDIVIRGVGETLPVACVAPAP
jgi:hypothetical protein